jgi:DNA-binding PadR family transcriptional regulator
MQRITLLSYAILGLLHGKASSGYELRKVFAETPMGSFSDSPGAIYPALRRLEDLKLIVASPIAGPSQRRRRILQLTREGIGALKGWLRTRVEQEDVASRMNVLMLRFAFMEDVLGESATLVFLREFERELNAYVAVLGEYVRGDLGSMATSAQLALRSGLLGYRAQAKWVAHAIKIYQGKVKR